ncbi:MAG: NAD(+) synthase, partial [Candidatus Omnitrophica bacterium]|nr:NAD(+) synthase [Candidatus Omnitrophota bacterium]
DAEKLADNLNIRFRTVPIDRVFKTYLDDLKSEFAGLAPDVTEENLQARIRGNILMAFSNKFGWLVLTTGNKSEMAVGYCTLYGDMAGGFAVIKDVPRTYVYTLARWRNRLVSKRKKIIPESVMRRPPSAELRPNQKDEDSIPPYPVLDPILKAYIEEDKSYREIKDAGFSMHVLKKVIPLVDKSEYKRRQGPPGIKITPKAFGKDRRMPITNRYREF